MSFSNFAWTQAHRLLGLPEKERRAALKKMRAEFKDNPFMRETEQAMSYINANPEELAKVVPAESKVLRDVVKGLWGELRAVEALPLDGKGSKIEKLYDIRKRAAKERHVDGQDRDSLMAIERRVCDVLVELAFKERVLLGRAHVAQQLFEGAGRPRARYHITQQRGRMQHALPREVTGPALLEEAARHMALEYDSLMVSYYDPDSGHPSAQDIYQAADLHLRRITHSMCTAAEPALAQHRAGEPLPGEMTVVITRDEDQDDRT